MDFLFLLFFFMAMKNTRITGFFDKVFAWNSRWLFSTNHKDIGIFRLLAFYMSIECGVNIVLFYQIVVVCNFFSVTWCTKGYDIQPVMNTEACTFANLIVELRKKVELLNLKITQESNNALVEKMVIQRNEAIEVLSKDEVDVDIQSVKRCYEAIDHILMPPPPPGPLPRKVENSFDLGCSESLTLDDLFF